MVLMNPACEEKKYEYDEAIKTHMATLFAKNEVQSKVSKIIG